MRRTHVGGLSFVVLSCLSASGMSLAGAQVGGGTPIPNAAGATATDAVRFRHEFGLEATPEHVLAVARGQRGPTTAEYGLPLTSAEAAKIATQTRIDGRLGAAQLSLADELKGRFEGLWIDHAAGGIVHVAVTGDPATAGGETLRALRGPTQVVVSSAPVTLDQLKATQARVSTGTSRVTTATVVQSYIDVRTAEVVVGVDREPEKARDEIRLLAASDRVRTVRVPAPGPLDRSTNFPPVKAGLQINSPTARCTSSIGTHIQAQRFVLTAGHCETSGPGATGSAWSVGSFAAFGTMVGNNFVNGTNADAAAITVSAGDSGGVSCVYHSDGDCRRAIGYIDPVIGQLVCFSGSSTNGIGCGTVVSTTFSGTYTGQGVSFNNLHLATACPIPGDSGSPVFSTEGSLDVSHGILSGVAQGGDGGCQMTYSPWSQISFALGLRPEWTSVGRDSIGVHRPSAVSFYLTDSLGSGAPTEYVASFGLSTDIAVSGDWDADGRDSIGIFRPSEGRFYLSNSRSGGPPANYAVLFGAGSDIPVTGDWDGDGRDSVGVFRPSTAHFYLTNSFAAAAPTNYDVLLGDRAIGQWPVTGTATACRRPGSSVRPRLAST